MFCGEREIPDQGANYHVQLLGGRAVVGSHYSQLLTHWQGVESQGVGPISTFGKAGVSVQLVWLGKAYYSHLGGLQYVTQKPNISMKLLGCSMQLLMDSVAVQ